MGSLVVLVGIALHWRELVLEGHVALNLLHLGAKLAGSARSATSDSFSHLILLLRVLFGMAAILHSRIHRDALFKCCRLLLGSLGCVASALATDDRGLSEVARSASIICELVTVAKDDVCHATVTLSVNKAGRIHQTGHVDRQRRRGLILIYAEVAVHAEASASSRRQLGLFRQDLAIEQRSLLSDIRLRPATHGWLSPERIIEGGLVWHVSHVKLVAHRVSS